MTYRLSFFPRTRSFLAVALVALGSACTPGTEPVGMVGDTETGSGSGEPGSGSSDDLDTGATSTSGGSGTSEPPDPDSSTGEPPDTQACDAPDPEVDASFSVDIHDWPGADEFEVEYDVNCEIVSMNGNPLETIAPTLECDVDGMLLTVDITMADPQLPAPGGQLVPQMEEGQPVRFHYWGVQDAGGLVDGEPPAHAHLLLEEFSIHAANTESPVLLAAGSNAWGLPASVYEPLTIEAEREFCPADDPEADRPMRLTFTDDTSTSISIVGGHRGLLDSFGSAESGYAIDLEDATAIFVPTHTDATYRVLVRLMVSDEG